MKWFGFYMAAQGLSCRAWLKAAQVVVCGRDVLAGGLKKVKGRGVMPGRKRVDLVQRAAPGAR
jgi:hypothetical protein